MTMTPDQDVRYLDAARAYGPALQRLARATEANADRQLDLLQDMHVALWRSFGRFDDRCSLSTWVYRVIHNVAASHVDRERRQQAGAVTLDAVSELPDMASPAHAVERSDALERLTVWMRKLKSSDRQIMTLYLEDLSASDIGEITGLSSGAVATRIFRLKAQLSKDFQEVAHA
jgi:RNA polymerase sigma-70 factor (ECF subfamily)